MGAKGELLFVVKERPMFFFAGLWDRDPDDSGTRAFTMVTTEANDYVVNGKPAIEWIMERYQGSVDKDSGIRNDPNDWAREHHQPRTIVDLLKRVVRALGYRRLRRGG